MKTILSHTERERIATADINHENEIVVVKQGKESIALNFKQFRILYEDVNFYNQIQPLHIKV